MSFPEYIAHTFSGALKDRIEDEMRWTVHIASGGDLQCTGTVVGSIFQHVLTHSSCCPSPSETNMVIVVSYGRSGKIKCSELTSTDPI